MWGMDALRAPTLAFNLFDDVSITAHGGVQPSVNRQASRVTLWTGQVVGADLSAVVVASDGAALDARVVIGGRVYHVQPVGADIVRISEIDMAAGRHDAQGRPIDDACRICRRQRTSRTVNGRAQRSARTTARLST
ncbi:MAG: hypothetical protein UZ13_03875 [Chloroflexi bacterium OLB13]|nr:MAG: hypothetical protein UZ13_03875 [Chloroflexi bacterium OLB13]